MKHHNGYDVETAVEDICTQGCAEVYRIINKLEKKQEVPALSSLTHFEQKQVLAELKSIMAVYDARDGSQPGVCGLARQGRS